MLSLLSPGAHGLRSVQSDICFSRIFIEWHEVRLV